MENTPVTKIEKVEESTAADHALMPRSSKIEKVQESCAADHALMPRSSKKQ